MTYKATSPNLSNENPNSTAPEYHLIMITKSDPVAVSRLESK